MVTPREVPPEFEATWDAVGRVLAWHEKLHAFTVTEDGAAAFVLVDTNSDGREIELTIFRNVDGRWISVLELDDVGDPGTEPVEELGYAYGRSEASAVTLSCNDQLYPVRVDSLGWWAFLSGLDLGSVGVLATVLRVD